MLSRTANYAVRAVVVLARHYGERSMSADELAATLGAPRNYLSKTLNALTRSGILTSARGPGGGYALAVAPNALSVAAIADVFSEARPDARCVLDNTRCHPDTPCSAHHRWTRITEDARALMRHTVIGDLCGSRHTDVASRP